MVWKLRGEQCERWKGCPGTVKDVENSGLGTSPFSTLRPSSFVEAKRALKPDTYAQQQWNWPILGKKSNPGAAFCSIVSRIDTVDYK